MKLQLVTIICLLAIARANFVKRLLGGRNLERGTFTNVVRVVGQRRRSPIRIFHNGVIFNPNWIVVTADCIYGIRKLVPMRSVRVIAGQWNRTAMEDSAQGRGVVYTRKYSDTYRSRLGKSINLGLLKLDRALDISEFVSAIPFSRNLTYPLGNAVMVGWGSTTIEDALIARLATIIQIISVAIIPKEECIAAINLMVEHGHFASARDYNRYNLCTGRFRPSFLAEIDPSNIRGSTHGDDGVPLMQQDEQGEYKVIGIKSVGAPIVDLSVETHVAPFVEWFENEIAAF